MSNDGTDDEYRKYVMENHAVQNHYREMREKQNIVYVTNMAHKWTPTVGERSMTIKDAFNLLSTFVDSSDPDTADSNIQHMFQTAEEIRRDKMPEWLQLVGLLHDLGKIMALWGEEKDGQTAEKQWGVCGDTWVLGYDGYDHTVFPEFVGDSAVIEYKNNCGMDNLICAWGHDEYLYRILRDQCKLPDIALKVIRYHSLYPWHKDGAYIEFCDEDAGDFDVLRWVKIFNNYDLYTKHDEPLNVNELWPYYERLIEKYVPGEINF
jgi:inositol oxygenase